VSVKASLGGANFARITGYRAMNWHEFTPSPEKPAEPRRVGCCIAAIPA